MAKNPDHSAEDARVEDRPDQLGEDLAPIRHPSAADGGELHRDRRPSAYTHRDLIAGESAGPDAYTEHRDRIHDGAYDSNEIDIPDRSAKKSHGPTAHDDISTDQTGR